MLILYLFLHIIIKEMKILIQDSTMLFQFGGIFLQQHKKAFFKNFRLRPTQVIIIGFAAVILFGGFLLSLPFSAANPAQTVHFQDAVFTSTTAVCVTGLITVDTGSSYSTLGHIIIICLVQFGGLGFMTVATMLLMMLGRRITLRERLVIQESLGESGLRGLVRMVRRVVLMTFVIELAGAVAMSFRFIPKLGLGWGVFTSIFQSISSFCNAGLDIFGKYNPNLAFTSLDTYVTDPLINITVMSLIVLGGLGFCVIEDLLRQRFRFRKLALHSKVVISMTITMILGGALFFYLVETRNVQDVSTFAENGIAKTIGDPNLSTGQQIMASFFQSVTPRTCGYETVPQANLTPASKVMTVILMFIGASPASTGGGIKTTTAFIILITILSVLRGRENITAFERRMEADVLRKALTLSVFALILVVVGAMAISLIESGFGNNFNMLDLVFETTSAFGTVGISSVGTPHLARASQTLLILTMYIGRVGPLTLMVALSVRSPKNGTNPPEGHILLG